MTFEVNPASIAVEGVGFGHQAMATLGWYLVNVEVVDLPTGGRGIGHPDVGMGGGGAVQTPRQRKQSQQTIVALYKGKLVEFNPARDTDKKLVYITAQFGDYQVKRALLVDAQRIPLIMKVTNWTNKTFKDLSVQVTNLRERVSRLKVSGGNFRRPKLWWWKEPPQG